MSLRHCRLRTEPDVCLHYVEGGSAGGPLVLLLHGFPECCFSWALQLPALCAAGCHVAALDLRGYGDSSRPSGLHRYSQESVCADVAALLAHLQADAAGGSSGGGGAAASEASAAAVEQRAPGACSGAVLVGHGWGAHIAWLAAALHPHLVSAVVSLATPHPAVFAQHMSLWRPLAALRYSYWWLFLCPWLPQRLLLRNRCRMLRSILTGQPLSPPPAAFVERHVSAFSSPTAITAAISYHRAFLCGLWGFCRIPPVRQPALLLWAEKDVYATTAMAQVPHALAPNAVVLRLPLSYWCMWDDPDAVNAHLIEFIFSVGSRAKKSVPH